MPIEQKNNEISEHFAMRRAVYDAAINDGKNEERAYLLASIFANCYHYGAHY